jgi:Uma2 family endonuclease
MASLLALETPRLLTVDEFQRIDFGSDLKAELDNGVIRMMAGGTLAHAMVQRNILFVLRGLLRGSGCRPYGSDLGVRTHDLGLRYPDVSVDCGKLVNRDDVRLVEPRIVVEVLSPSTTSHDRLVKLPEYQAVPSMREIMFVDPETERVWLAIRSPGGEWSGDWVAPSQDVHLPSLELIIPHAEIFATD